MKARDGSKAPLNRCFLAVAVAVVGLMGVPTAAAFAQNAPSLVVDPASKVGVTSASLSGQVDPEGEAGSPPTYFNFEVSAADESGSAPDGNWIYAGGVPDGELSGPEAEASDPVAVEGLAESLSPATKYFIRLVADNAEFANHTVTEAPYQSFTTAAAVEPLLSTEPATGIGYSSATLHGTVDGNGGNLNPASSEEVAPIYYYLQYSHDPDAEGWATGSEGWIEGKAATEATEVEAALPPGTLQAGRTYKVRVLVSYLGFSREAISPESELAADEFTTLAAMAPAVTIEDASSVTGTSAHFAGTVDPGGADPAFNSSCWFDYVTDAQFQAAAEGGFTQAQSVECQPSPVEGAGSHGVLADAVGLLPSTTYHLRIRAENQGGPTTAAAGTFATQAIAPIVGHTSVSLVTPEVAILHAQINPGGAATTYHFEYVTEAQFGIDGFDSANTTPESASLGSDDSEYQATATLSGLQADTTYRYRAVATNAVQEVKGPTRRFRTAAIAAPQLDSCQNAGRRAETHSASLPDCRAWEMVTPPDKNGVDVIPDSGRTRAANDGAALGFHTLGAFGDTEGTDVSTEYIARRSSAAEPGDNGWTSHGVSPNQIPNNGQGATVQFHAQYQGELSADLNRGVISSFTPLTEDPSVAEVPNLYLRSNLLTPGKAAYELLTACPRCAEESTPLPSPPLNIQAGNLEPKLAWAQPSFDRVIFESKQPLTADTPTAQNCDRSSPLELLLLCPVHVYEAGHGETVLAGRVPVPPATACDDQAGPPCVAADVSTAGAGTGLGLASEHLLPNTISDGSDGHTRVFFTQPTDDSGTTSSEAGNDLNINRSDRGRLFMRVDGRSTVQIDASERSSTAAFGRSMFLDASRDGRRAFFMSPAALTDDAVDNGSRRLYMYAIEPDAQGKHLTLISGPGKAPGNSYEVLGAVGVSVKGDYVYFTAQGEVLDGEPSSAHGSNLYLWHDGQLKLVSPVPGPSVANETNSANVLFDMQARVAPDGRHLLFATESGIGVLSSHGEPDYDQGTCGGSESIGCRELYLYSADSDTLTCATCNPRGVPALTHAADVVRVNNASASSTWHRSRALSSDGRYVFFSSGDALVSEDTNGVYDAYVYDSTSGAMSLISSGHSPEDSYFLEATPSGSDVFFATRQRISGWDVDTSYDIYDARIGGGFPEPRPGPAACVGDSCRGSASAAPPFSKAASANFAGPGNAKPRHRCAKGKRKIKTRKGKTRCVAKKKARSRRSHKERAHGDRGGRR